jgi:flagellar basal body-associated protein FliL
MSKKFKNKKKGFLKLIILIVTALFLIRYFHISFWDIIDWIKNLISHIF